MLFALYLLMFEPDVDDQKESTIGRDGGVFNDKEVEGYRRVEQVEEIR